MGKTKTAIVLFTRLPQDEQKLAAEFSPQASTGLFQRLITHVSRAATKIENADFLFSLATDSPRPAQQGFYTQRGRTFGERLAHAFLDAYAFGYERVIAVGNDCAELTAGDLANAVRALETNDCVIGPSEDGGVYLIGLKSVPPHFLARIRWQKKTDFATLVQRLVLDERSVHLLERHLDIDSIDDLRRFAARHRRSVDYAKLIVYIDACLASHRARREGVEFLEPPFLSTVGEKGVDWQIPPPIVRV